jgi:type III secretory pathway component EscU
MSGEKTEMPTPKKLRDARKKGQVSKSTDVVSTSLLTVLYIYIGVGWSNHVKAIGNMLFFRKLSVGRFQNGRFQRRCWNF